MHWRRKWQPTQCSCLENPRDGGAWWAAVYGVAQSQTRLQRLGSNSIQSSLSFESKTFLNGKMNSIHSMNFFILSLLLPKIGKTAKTVEIIYPEHTCEGCFKWHCCVLSRFSRVRLFATLWTVAHQAPLSMGILQARTLEWVTMSSFRASFHPRDRTQVSCLLHWQVSSLPPAPSENPYD